MNYSRQDLRAIDMFALFMLGGGLLFAVFGLLAKTPRLALLGGVFLCLATALNTVLRRVIRNGGADPEPDLLDQTQGRTDLQ